MQMHMCVSKASRWCVELQETIFIAETWKCLTNTTAVKEMFSFLSALNQTHPSISNYACALEHVKDKGEGLSWAGNSNCVYFNKI